MKIQFRGKLSEVKKPKEFGDKRLIEYIITIEAYRNQYGEVKGKDSHLIVQLWEDANKPSLIHNVTKNINQIVEVQAYLNGVKTERADGKVYINNHLRHINLQEV
jgi:hypothetical protein